MTLVEEIRCDPERGAKRLQRECKPGLLALARRLCDDEGDAEELVNRTFADVVANIASLESETALFNWMCTIMVGSRSKETRRKSAIVEACDQERVDGAEDRDAQAKIFREVDAGLLREAIESLPPEARETVVLHYFLDQPLAKVAKVLALPIGTVKSRLHYARAALGAKLGAAAEKPSVKAVVAVVAAIALFAGAAVLSGTGGASRPQEGGEAAPPAEEESAEALLAALERREAAEAANVICAPSGEESGGGGDIDEKDENMDSPKLKAALSASAAALAASAATPFFESGWPAPDPSVSAASAAGALVSAPLSAQSGPGGLEARFRVSAASEGGALYSTPGGGFMIMLR